MNLWLNKLILDRIILKLVIYTPIQKSGGYDKSKRGINLECDIQQITMGVIVMGQQNFGHIVNFPKKPQLDGELCVAMECTD